jgi:hypothetical protein
VEEKVNVLFQSLHFKVPSFDTIKTQVNTLCWEELATKSEDPSMCTIDDLLDAVHVSDVIDMSSISGEETLYQSRNIMPFHYSLVTEHILSQIENLQDADEHDHNCPHDNASALCKSYFETIRILLREGNLCSR